MKALDSNNNRRARRSRGFSLAEATIVVAIIGVMTALALPMISQLTTDSGASKTRRTARELASLAASAVAAGDASIPAAPDAEAAVRLLTKGVTITEGIEGMRFEMRALAESEIAHVARYLRMVDGILVYVEPVERK